MTTALQTPICGLLGCDYPIVLAGMGGVARSELVAAVSEAGGFGFLGMVREPPDLIRAEIDNVRAATTRDFGVNLIPAATETELLEAEIGAVLAAHVPVVALFWDMRSDIVRRLLHAGCLVVCQVGSVREAVEAAEAGAHIVIAQGQEAGGHVRGRTDLPSLLPGIVSQVDIPILAAGGIVDGKDVASVLRLGAQGAVIGTGFLATRESFAHDYHKGRILQARPGETVHTQDFHINWPRGAAVRVLPNSVTRGARGNPFDSVPQIIGDELGRPIYLFSTDSPLRDMTGDYEAMALYAGSGAGRIESIPSAADRLTAIVEEASRLLGGTSERASVTPAFASPACSAQEATDSYMGFADSPEIAAFLNILLEAERAGARVTLRSALSSADSDLATLMRAIHADEARWCAMLLRHIKALGEIPSPRVGNFYGKAMAIEDLGARIAFLNRGQKWVVRKLEEILPRIRDDGLHADLTDMLRSHLANISLAEDGPGKSASRTDEADL